MAWKKIKKDGLVPYPVRNEETKKYFPDGLTGVYLWAKKFRGLTHIGNLFYQFSSKKDLDIVRLRVVTQRESLVHWNGHLVETTHYSDIGGFRCYEHELAFIHEGIIFPHNISLDGRWKIGELLK
jgi:hypothetical protein